MLLTVGHAAHANLVTGDLAFDRQVASGVGIWTLGSIANDEALVDAHHKPEHNNCEFDRKVEDISSERAAPEPALCLGDG